MAVTLNPLKSAASAIGAGHINDVILPSTSSVGNYYDFPEVPQIQDALLLAINCSVGGGDGDWFNTSCNVVGDDDNATLRNGTLGAAAAQEPLYDVILMGLTSVFLGLMILITVIGNVFVIAAILLERNLQNVANYLIVSLAVADLMVACLVMPLGAVYEISKGWILGPEVCDMWTSSDVLCCTASILHLVAIAVDRYWAVTNVDYIHTRNGNRIGAMIVVVWAVALIVSLAPQFGWKDEKYLDRINLEQRCMPSQDIGYQIFATFSTFYVPLLVILILYWKIFQTARKRIHRRQRPTISENPTKTNNNTSVSNHFLKKRKFLRMKRCNKKKSSAAEALVSSLVMVEGHSTTTVDVLEEVDEKAHSANNKEEETTAFTISKGDLQNKNLPVISNNISPEKSSATTTNNGSASHQSHISDISRVEILVKDGTKQVEIADPPVPQITASSVVTSTPSVVVENQVMTAKQKKESLEAKRERKAAKTLAIITGAFVVCWLPFFVMALVMPLCGSSCNISDYMISFFLWLGYFNSTLNPVIYTIFSPEFRQAFTRMLCGAKRARRVKNNFRSNKLR